jgi:AraC-like DNA-binding protein
MSDEAKTSSGQVLQVCTADIVEHQRADYWIAACRSVWGDIDLLSSATKDFYGALRSGRIASSQVTWASLGNMDLGRSRPQATPFYSVAFSIRGQSTIVNDSREVALEPSSVLLIDSSRPTTFRVDGLRSNSGGTADVHDKFSVQLPAQMIRDRLGADRGFPPVRLNRTSAGASVVWQFVRALYSSGPAPDERSAGFFERQLCDLIAFCFSPSQGALSEDSALLVAHRQRVAQWIERHHASEQISPQTIATACGISISYLHKIYRGNGRSVMEHVRDVRLDVAHARLKQCRPPTTISEIAYSVGYRSLSDFSRAYKLRFGYSPSWTRP